MKTIIKITLISLFAFACSGNNLIEPGELESPLLMHVFCQASPNDTLMRFEYEYNNDLLISETKFTLRELQNKVTFQYNSNNQITSELSEWDHLTVEKTYHYNSSGQLEKITYKTRNFDENGQLTSEEESEATFEYQNGLVIKEWENWGGFITYEYKDEKLVKKID
ncbi:MAG: hypothetical protein KDD63_21485, partial [Bacteroidetes bacterium]|nr:hypothetical protein [Bacteroidota bacterium]